MRNEIIDYLIRNNIEVLESTIRDVEKTGLRSSTIESILDPNSRIDSVMMNKIYNFVVSKMSESIEDRSRMEDQFLSKRKDLEDRFDLLHRNVQAALSEIRSAQILEKNMSGYVDTINVDFSDNSIIDKDNTTAIISDGIVIGEIMDPSEAEKESVRVKEYTYKSLSATIRELGNSSIARVEKLNDSGIGYIASASEPVINNGSGFKLAADTEFPGEKKIDLLIDKEDSEYFNQIEIKLNKAHLIQILVSDNNREFEKVLDKPRYAKNTVIPVGSFHSRYVKIVFYKNKYDYRVNGRYGYSVDVKELNILRSTLNSTAVFETNKININGSYSALSIGTCCNQSSNNVDIEYKVSIDEGPWKSIRPVDKHNVGEILDPVAVSINGYTDNKLISITDFEETDSGYVSPLELPEDFLGSNTLRVFSNDITNTASDWITDNRYYTVYGILLSPKDMDVGNTSIEVNGKWATGRFTMSRGIYKIRVYSENYANLFNANNATLVSEVNGEYVVKDSEGVTRRISDPLYPYNHKIIVENTFDYLFGRELIEKEDYTLYNNGDSFNLATSNLYEEVIVAYKLHVSNTDNVRLRIELTSKDKTTIPYVERALIRLA